MAPATINRYAAALAAVLTWAIKKRIAPRGWENPCKGIERRPEDNEVVRFLSESERVALLSECKKSVWSKLYLFVLIALTTGARRGEIERMRWGDFALGLEQPVCSVNKTKNGDRKVLPLVPAVVEELRRHMGAPTALVFASKRRPDVAYNHVPSWHRALKGAGVRNCRFHDLRHSCASYLAQSGATLLEIAEVLGHRQLSVTKRGPRQIASRLFNVVVAWARSAARSASGTLAMFFAINDVRGFPASISSCPSRKCQ